jgi:hypothetical protein
VRYRLVATYRGVLYEAGVGPTDKDVVLFAACPPPEELGFQPATGHWRKAVSRAEVDAVWESRPSGSFGGEPCLVLDDLGEHLHISYLGDDLSQAERLGYTQVEPGVWELLAAREHVTGIAEERVDHPFLPWQQGWHPDTAEPAVTVPDAEPGPAAAYPEPMTEPWGVAAFLEPPADAGGLTARLEPRPDLPDAAPPEIGALIPPQGARQGRAAGRPPRAATRQVFAELVDLAALPQDAYAVDEAVDGAICLVGTDGGFEVFSAVDGVKQEARFFQNEEAAYFYLFGLLTAEAVRDGRLVPPPGTFSGISAP